MLCYKTTSKSPCDYSYRIEIKAWVFVAIGLAAILIALASVSFQTIKAALMNPVKSLRSE